MNQKLSPATDKDILILNHWHELPPPLFILAPPRSFTSIVCAMLGQHPQMYGLPEMHLFQVETMTARAALIDQVPYPMGSGLLRAIAQLYYGEQNERTVQMARRWLSRRPDVTTDFIFKALADRVFPLIVVDKSPSNTNNPNVLQRIHSLFPRARFLHLLRHPRGQGESVIRFIGEREKDGPIPPTHWLMQISSKNPVQARTNGAEGLVLDPQVGWYRQHRTICDFLKTISSETQMRVRGEDLLGEPDRVLREIVNWMGLRNDVSAIEAMKHPEASPYAFFGPPGGRYGNDENFLRDPSPRFGRTKALRLEGPLGWRTDGQGFSDEVKRLAQELGYV